MLEEMLCLLSTQILRWIIKRNRISSACLTPCRWNIPSKTVGTKQIEGEKCLAGWLAERWDFSLLIQMFRFHGCTGRGCQADLWSLREGWYMSREHHTSKWVHGPVECEMRSHWLQPRHVTDLLGHFQVLLTDAPCICIHLITAHAETVKLLLVVIMESSAWM